MTEKNYIYSLGIKKGNELLPIGSVVNLAFIQQAVMIYGRKHVQTNKEVIWDYVVCPYTQGHLYDVTNNFFNNEQINDVIFKGFESEGKIILRSKILKATGEDKK